MAFVTINVRGIPGAIAALENVKHSVINILAKNGSMKGARKTVPVLKRKLARHRRTGQYQKALGTRYKGYPAKHRWVVMVGPRAKFDAFHPIYGRINPNLYAHLVEKGRQPLTAGMLGHSRGKVKRPGKPLPKAYPIKVRTLAGGKRANPTAIRFKRARLSVRRKGVMAPGRRVPGGWIIFRRATRGVPAEHLTERETRHCAHLTEEAVADEIRYGLPRLAARYAARGKSIYNR